MLQYLVVDMALLALEPSVATTTSCRASSNAGHWACTQPTSKAISDGEEGGHRWREDDGGTEGERRRVAGCLERGRTEEIRTEREGIACSAENVICDTTPCASMASIYSCDGSTKWNHPDSITVFQETTTGVYFPVAVCPRVRTSVLLMPATEAGLVYAAT